MSFYKRNLPHYQPEGYPFFITTRLSGTIPKDVYKRTKSEYEDALVKMAAYKSEKLKTKKYLGLHKQKFIKYERILNSCKYGYTWLSDKRIASLVQEAIHHRDKMLYELIAYTIMPNHMHLVILPIVERFAESLKSAQKKKRSETGVSLYIATKIMQDLKKFTAREANKVLNRSGKFWQHESYDHVIRDNKELRWIVKYILNNPVKANLCEKPED